MDTLLNEIKQLAQQGLEKSIISRDEENKDIFMQIMLKAEVAINKVEQSSAHKSVVVEKENFSRLVCFCACMLDKNQCNAFRHCHGGQTNG